ncbi:MAG: putative Ig domain-containing protein, partial [Kiritimatiellae bacterium]|nr:putative Ig domain-containing protein [Kiritimatiellia bacterium]
CYEGAVELPIPETPRDFAAEDARRIGFVRTTWSAADWAWSYAVERSANESFAEFETIGTTTALFFDDTNAVPETVYWYRVMGVNPEGGGEPSDPDAGSCLGALVVADPDFGTLTAGLPCELHFSASGGAGSYVWRTAADDYAVENADSSWILDDGTPVGVSGDDVCNAYPLPFDFPFYGSAYNKVWVSSNGTLTFDSAWTSYSASLADLKARVAIAVFWKDLRTGGSGVTVVQNGTESVTFRWQNCSYYSGGGAVNASATLFADGTIVCSYGSGNASGAFVGISAGDGVRYEEINLVGTSMANADDIVFEPQGIRGLTLSSDGTLSGTPDAAGTHSFTVAVADAYGNVATRRVELVVEENPNLRVVTFSPGAHGTRVGGGALVQGVLLGDSATAPVLRAASGWVFDGWDGGFTNIQDNVTVTAQWRPAKPAIRVIDVAAPVAVNAGDDMEVTWTLENWGNAAFNGTMAEEVRLVPAGGGAAVTMATLSFSDEIPRDGSVSRSASFVLPKKGMEGEWTVRVVSALRPSVSLHETGVSADAANALSVSPIPLPDLAAADVAATPDALVPGGTVTVSYTVGNDGAADAEGSWTDSVYLVSETSGTEVKLADLSRTGPLVSGGTRAESAEIAIPETIALTGGVRVKVVADSGNAVVEADDENNAAMAADAAALSSRLALSAASTSVSEASGSVRFTVKRSGPRDAALAVVLASSPSGQLSVPETVTISAGSASATFTVLAIDNATVEGSRVATVSVAADGFDGGSVPITVTDNETPHLYLSLSGETVREGGTLSGTVRRELVTDSALVVYLSGPSTSRCTYPSSVTIPAGEGSAAFEISVPDNTTSQREAAYTLRASASGHVAATVPLAVEDDDIPGFTLELYPEMASEGAGPNAVYATLTRADQSQIAKDVTVRLSQSPAGNLILPASITIPKYTMAVRFAIGTVDNALDDGDREVTIDGAVVIEDCGCDGQPSTGDAIRAALTVIDDDGPALSLKAEPATMKEGLDEAGFLVLSHNSALAEDLEVALSFDVEGEIDIPATATIPAGATSVRIPVRTLDDGVEDGAKLVSVYAEEVVGEAAPGEPEPMAAFAPASTWLQVSDQNLPDLAVATVAVPASVVAMERFAVSFVVTNQGFMARSGAVPYAVHLVRGANGFTVSSSTLVASGSLTGGIGVDGVLAGEAALSAPELPGDFRIAVVVDPDGAISELDSANNTGWSPAFGVSAAYAAEVAADADSYLPGDTITI